jgi:hypothetical protein
MKLSHELKNDLKLKINQLSELVETQNKKITETSANYENFKRHKFMQNDELKSDEDQDQHEHEHEKGNESDTEKTSEHENISDDISENINSEGEIIDPNDIGSNSQSIMDSNNKDHKPDIRTTSSEMKISDFLKKINTSDSK